ncbi:hypothetical protein CDAR_165181 [Caerostris darwini]|uniref:Uncharacterized protein n=1 Tax=Caerostris darwini TaxID=1538125 RepID=A0AAV4P0I5_9ARAC|nr:hypothetical protein CDAR_165181 [Caerostris darwini]
MYFPTKLNCQTHHNSVLEHEHKRLHPKNCIPEAAVRMSSSPSMGMISTTLVIQKKCVLLRSMHLKVVRNTIRFYKRSREVYADNNLFMNTE